MAIVASGYLFSDDSAFYVDVFNGDTPNSLMDRHAPGSRVVSAAVLDVDVPGQTLPVAIAADEPIVVVGSSPRTSVFVCAETMDDESNSPSDSEGEPSSPLPSPTAPPSPLAINDTQEEQTSTPAELVASAIETLERVADESEDSKEIKSADCTEVNKENRAREVHKFSKTRRVRKQPAKGGTRRSTKPIQIELI